MSIHQHASTPRDVRTCAHDGSPIPDWVRAHMAAKTAPNGTFLISTALGT
jgi:hypothetical protein